MGTKIEWTDSTWNPITGCTPISDGCKHCYARRMARRLAGRCGYPESPHHFDVTFHPDRLDEPRRWRKPSMAFVCSMGDLFHEDVRDEWIRDIFDVMARCPQHTFQILTKRPDRMHDLITRWLQFGNPEPNVWLGVTAENQAEADKRIPVLLDTPAAVRFVSIEPMLGAVDLNNLQCIGLSWDVLNGYQFNIENAGSQYNCQAGTAQLDWVIVGGETGPGARPMHPDWARSVRDQCVEAGVPFFFKQTGGAYERSRLLDGREWNEFPEVVK